MHNLLSTMLFPFSWLGVGKTLVTLGRDHVEIIMLLVGLDNPVWPSHI